MAFLRHSVKYFITKKTLVNRENQAIRRLFGFLCLRMGARDGKKEEKERDPGCLGNVHGSLRSVSSHMILIGSVDKSPDSFHIIILF